MYKLIALLIALLIAPAATAAPVGFIWWTNWQYFVPGSPGFAFGGNFGGVSYTGNLVDVWRDMPSWLPPTTFGNQPPIPTLGAVVVPGGPVGLNKLEFRPGLVDPYIAVWRLGREGAPGQLLFNHPLIIDSGGPSLEYGGSSILPLYDLGVLGEEGNGVFHFKGTYRSLSWISVTDAPYVFTVGATGVAWCFFGSCDEPLTLSLFAVAIGGLGLWRRRLRQSIPCSCT